MPGNFEITTYLFIAMEIDFPNFFPPSPKKKLSFTLKINKNENKNINPNLKL